jgi:alcohol sulfotransferase
VRRAKVGGYQDYFDDQQLAEIDHIVESTLASIYGYGKKDNDLQCDLA